MTAKQDVEKFLIDLTMSSYKLENGLIGEELILELARKNNIEEAVPVPVSSKAAIKKTTAVNFADGITRYIHAHEQLNADIDKVVFLTKNEHQYLLDSQVKSLNDLLVKEKDINILSHSPKLYAKLETYLNGIYIRYNSGKMITGIVKAQLPINKTYIIHNPNGSQDAPDFVILWHNDEWQCLPIDDKTSNSGKIVWNSGLNKSGYLYSFSCTTLPQHYLFMGEDYSSLETINKLIDMRKELVEKVRILNTSLKENSENDEYNEFYVRPMHNAKRYDTSLNRIRNHNRAIEKLLTLGIDAARLRVNN